MHEIPGAFPVEQQEDAVFARSLLRRSAQAALATSLDGAPYASLALVAVDLDGGPLLLLSDLAQHSRNIAADPRLALLFDGSTDQVEPLAGPRLTVLGTAAPSRDRRLLARFTARHPNSRRYADFNDFHLYRVHIERGHLVAGFGRITWIAGAALVSAGAAALAAAEPEILAQMNTDRAGMVDLLAAHLLDRAGRGWHMTGIDPEGIDLRRGGEIARLDFPAPAPTPQAVRQALAALVAAARSRTASRAKP
jgi:putative heme iron utilization protein